MFQEISRELIDFIDHNPSCYHVIQNISAQLKVAGYTSLSEGSAWTLQAGGKYFVTRNSSSVIAFQVPDRSFCGFQIISSHSDSPTFKLKEHPELEAGGHYIKLNVEGYGGMICGPWFDRPLSVAGRLLVKSEEEIVTKLVHVDRDLVMIPNLSVHMNREVNQGYKFNVQTDLLPIFGDEASKDSFMDLIADCAGVLKENILGSDLFLYNRVKGTIWGAKEEYLSCARLDDLQCAFGSLKGFLEAQNTKSVPVYCVFDNEEVGSTTKQGAASTFLKDTLTRINRALGRTEEEYFTALASSFMVSADNAHAVHPNYIDKADPTHRPFMNGGIVIKYSANQKYTTDGVSAAIFKTICQRAKVPYQAFANRSDMAGGSTLGNISTTQVALNSVDIGLPQLSMHSPYETAGTKDTAYLVMAAREFFSSCISSREDGSYRIEKY